MLKIKMHAIYDHFPEYNPQKGDKCINCYADRKVSECKRPGKNIAMLFEPKSLIADAYKYVSEHPEYFKYIFTHDSELLKLPNAKMLNWADVWLTTDSEKTKPISLITSPKDWCPLHRERLKLYERFKAAGGVDVFYGDWNNPKIPEVGAREYLEHYKFSIVIENDIDEFWFTEKLLNCFATKTVPIYTGATRIGEIFNADGIIELPYTDMITSTVINLRIDEEYEKRREAIEDNFKRVEPYKTPWKERFFRDYGELLEEMNG